MLSLLLFARPAQSALLRNDAPGVDCCRCDDRYTQESRITWYGSALTCERQPMVDVKCHRIRVEGRSCQTTRWVPSAEGLRCETVQLKATDENGKSQALELHAMSACQTRLALKAVGAQLAHVQNGLKTTLVAGNGGMNSSAFCSCDRDPSEPSSCALFRMEGGKASIVDSKPLPNGSGHCDRATCSDLFLAEHASSCPAYYQGAPTLTASQ